MEKGQIIDELKFDEKGLIPAIAQDAETGQIMMFAYMNREAVEQTMDTGIVTYWSRSRKKLWVKGESSGHTQELKEIWFDCDHDCLLLKIKQNVAACHKGFRSCFFNKIEEGKIKVIGEKVFEIDEVYKK